LTCTESLYVEALYDGGVHKACEATADIFALVDSLELWDRLVVVVLSDHGEEFWDHFGVFASHCHSLYEELLSVPFLLYCPRRTGFHTIGEHVSLVDLLPTLIDLLGLQSTAEFDGVSLVPLIESGFIHRDVPIMATMHNEATGEGQCVFSSDAKYMEVSYSRPLPANDRSGRRSKETRELYLLDMDPKENRDLFGQDEGLADAMAESLRLAEERAQPPVTADYQAQDIGLSPDLKKHLQLLGCLDSD